MTACNTETATRIAPVNGNLAVVVFCVWDSAVQADCVYRTATYFVSCVTVADALKNVYARPSLALPMDLMNFSTTNHRGEPLFCKAQSNRSKPEFP
jgi:hypothetical protein